MRSIPKRPVTCYMQSMKLADWARANGITYKTAHRMWKAGKLPVPAEQFATGTVVVHVASFSEAVRAALSLPPDDRRRLISEVEASL